MNLKRIYAKPGDGKTAMIIDDIVENRQQQLLEGLLSITPVIIIAPQQYSYSFEAQLSHRLTTIADIDISYFNRLAQHILQETGHIIPQVLTTSSQFLLMHKAILEVADHLTVFHSMAGNYQFTNDMIQLIKEFKQYSIAPNLLLNHITETLNERLSDVLLIYQQYDNLCVSREKLYDSEDILKLAIQNVKYSSQIAQSTIYITDFYNFSELEYQFIGQLIQYAKQVVIALSYPVENLKLQDGKQHTPIMEEDMVIENYKLSMWRKCFEIDAKLNSLVKHMNHNLIAEQQDELVDETWIILTDKYIMKYLMRHQQQNYQVALLSQQDNPYQRFKHEALKHIACDFDKFNSYQIAADDVVSMYAHQTLSDEVSTVCHDILKKMHNDSTLSWDDFAIMYRDSEQYVPLLKEMAHQYQIPIDISEKQFIKHHRLIRLLFKLLKIADNDWRRENILGVFKTGLVTYSQSIIYHLLTTIKNHMTIDSQQKLTISQWAPLFYQTIDQLPEATRHNWIKTNKELQKQFDKYRDDDTLYNVEEFSYQLGYFLTRVYDELDELENEIIKHNIQTKAQWQQPYIFGNPDYFEHKAQLATTPEQRQSYQFLSQKAQKYEDIRQAIVQVFTHQQAPCQFEASSTLGQYIEVIYNFLQITKVESHLSRTHGRTLTAQLKSQIDQDHQAWQKLIQLFEQLHQILANIVMDNDQFIDLLSATLNVLTYDNIPIGQNYVLAGNFDRIQFKNKQHVYLLGLNNQTLPRAISNQGLLTESDKEQLASLGLPYHSQSYLLMVDEELLAYRLFTSATNSVYMSYTTSSLSGVAQYISPYIQRLQDLFNDVEVQVTPASISLTYDYQQDILHQVVNNYELMRVINHYLQQIKAITYKGQAMIADEPSAQYNQQQLTLATQLLATQSDLLLNYQQLLSAHQVYGDTIYQALNYHHLPQNLQPQVAQLLYQAQSEYSVSRLETYNQSPYLYFLKYGLKLRPREQMMLDSAKIGSLWHEVMADARIIEQINQYTQAQEIPEKSQIETLVTQVLDDKIQANVVVQTLLQHQQLQYQQFIDLLTKIVMVEAYQHPFSAYERQVIDGKYSVEYDFTIDFDKGNEAYNQLQQLLGLDHLPKFTLKGIIDRIDINERGQSLQIVDYKSSYKELKWELLASGQQLQLVTYLWMTQFIPQLANYQPAGMYYFHMNNKTVDKMQYPSLAEQVKLYQLSGLTIADNEQQVLQHDNSNEGVILNIKTNKNGSLSKASLSSVLSTNELQTLYQVVLSKIVTTINHIYAGHIELTAIQHKQKWLTYFNDYEAICLFDEVKYPQQILRLTTLKKDDVLQEVTVHDRN